MDEKIKQKTDRLIGENIDGSGAVNPLAIMPKYRDAIIHCLANPADSRSLTDLAKEWGISPATVQQYYRRNRQSIDDSVSTVADQYISQIKTKALKTLYKRIDKSDAALKLGLQVAGQLIERSEVKTNPMTPDEKREKLKQLLRNINVNSTSGSDNSDSNDKGMRDGDGGVGSDGNGGMG